MRQSLLIATLSQASGGLDNLSKASGIDVTTLYRWWEGKAQADYNTIIMLLEHLRVHPSFNFKNIIELSGSIELGTDKNASALAFIRTRYNESKAIEIQRRLIDLYPEGVQIDAYHIHPRGEAVGFDVDGNTVDTDYSYKNRLSLSHPLTERKYRYFCF